MSEQDRREAAEILKRIAAGEISASMSCIEYYFEYLEEVDGRIVIKEEKPDE